MKSKLRQCLLLMISGLSIIFKSHCREEWREMEWSLMGFKVKSRYRVDASISGGCVRVILKERQCSPFSVIQDQYSLRKGREENKYPSMQFKCTVSC